jgi:glyoxylase-like metal-dependent hydrolase (beta-lactamase superfamily II)
MSSLIPLLSDLWVYPDTCNVYVLRDRNRALLIDLGSGDVLRHLPEIGVSKVEWVLYTHHHREQCQGHARLAGLNTKAAVPRLEADLFTDPASYFNQFSRYCVEAAPYARPPREPIPVDLRLQDGAAFDWGPYRFFCDHAPGHSPGMMVYRAEIAGRSVAFCGDLIRDGARLDTFYDSEWDYGFGAGMNALLRSVRLLKEARPEMLMPSHGNAPLSNAEATLSEMERKLTEFMPLYLRDWDMDENVFLSRRASAPTSVPGVRQVSPHLFSFVGNTLGHNCYALKSDSGRGLMVDAGIFLPNANDWLDEKLIAMREAFGLSGIDAVLVTHYHGDHVLQVPHLIERHGAQIWTHEAVVEPLLHPNRHNLTCPHTNYGLAADAVPVHRVLREGETLEWEEFRLQALHLPGQTEFAAGYYGEVDGQRVCFTGDNMFASPNRSGHDAFIARNRGILEEGYLKCADVLRKLNPDLLLGGHGQEIPHPRVQIERLRAWSVAFRQALVGLCPSSDYEYLIDPYWVEVVPHKLEVRPCQPTPATLALTNHRSEPSRMECAIHVPRGWSATPRSVTVEVPARERREIELTILCQNDEPSGWLPLTVDVTLNGERLGEKFDSRLRLTPGSHADET